MALLALAVAAIAGGIILPGLAFVALAAPRADAGSRLAMSVPLGVVVLCALQAAMAWAGLREWAPVAGAALPVAAAATLLARRGTASARPDATVAWAFAAAAAAMATTWLVAARFWPTLDSVGGAGLGVDDTPFHAACAAMFKIAFPAPDPTAEGFVQQAHFLVHLLGGALSAMYAIEAHSVFVRVIPFLVSGTLAFQVAIAARRFGGLRPALCALVAVLVVDGGNAAVLAAPALGARVTANHFPLPLPVLLWKLPGLGLAMLFVLPAMLLANAREAAVRLGTARGGWTTLAAVTCMGMCAAKPVAPIVLMAGLAAAQACAMLRARRADAGLVPFTLVLLATFACTAALSYDAGAYGYDESPFGPLRTATSAFRIDASLAPAARIALLAAALAAWLPLTAASLVAWVRCPSNRRTSAALSIACGAGLAGATAFLALWSPMGAELQFALAGKLLSDTAGAIAIATLVARTWPARPARAIAAGTAIAAVLLAPTVTRGWLDRGKPGDRRTGPRELDADTVEAMRWLRGRAAPDDTILLSNQVDRNGTENSAIAVAIAERQAYLACVRYSPGAYVPMSRGEPAPLATRIDEARRAFEGDRATIDRLRAGTRVRWLVRDRLMGDRFPEDALDGALGPPAFANARFEIHRLGPAAGPAPKGQGTP